jgi:CheY-like chemotaxis protein
MTEGKENKQTILVVDDAPANIDLLSSILSPHYKIKGAVNGEKALKIAHKTAQPDLILLDIIMPGMSGHEVCKQLKQDPVTAMIPVIFITAKTSAEDEQAGLELGAVDYITKPFNPVIVAARVRSHIAQHARSKQLYLENFILRQQVGTSFHDYSDAALRQVVSNGESDTVEFKSTLRFNLHSGKPDKKMENSCLKTIAAFLNSNGGLLLVGVDDSGTPLGLESDNFKNEDKLLLHWNNLFNTCLGLEFAQYVHSAVKDLSGKRVLVVQSLPASNPVFFSRENNEIFYIRAGNSTRQLKPSEILSYLDQRKCER